MAILPYGAKILAALAVLLAALPYIAGFLAAPRGSVFLGALNNLGDTGQYLAALRQGAEGHLLYVNQYSSLRVAPVLMYPLYTLAGLLFAPLRLSTMAAYQVLHLTAAIALLAALWRLCRLCAPRRPVLAYALALFGGGLYAPALLLSGLVRLPFAPVALTAPEFSLFATLLISPHGALGLAAELWALSGYLHWRRDRSGRGLGALGAGGLALGLCYPFGVVVLLAVVAIDIVLWAFIQPLTGLSRAVPAALALLPAAGIALYYALLFHYDPLWGASNMLRLPPPSVAVVLAAYSLLLALALPAARSIMRPQSARLAMRPQAPSPSRDMRAASLSGLIPWGVSQRLSRQSQAATPEGLLLIWAAVNGLLLLAPLPQSERLLNGWSVALALLAALTLQGFSRRAARRWAMALSCSNVLLALLYLSVTLRAGNAAFYAPKDELAAVDWLAAHARQSDVVMASAGSGNLIVSAAHCRVVVGQNFETFNWASAQRDVLRFYDTSTLPAERTEILRRHGVTLALAGPYERALGGFVPRGPGYRLVYQAGAVHIFAVKG